MNYIHLNACMYKQYVSFIYTIYIIYNVQCTMYVMCFKLCLVMDKLLTVTSMPSSLMLLYPQKERLSCSTLEAELIIFT